MKSISILIVILLMITLTACALGTLSVLPKFESPVSRTNLHRQEATIEVGNLKETIAPVITTPIPDETLVAYQEGTPITNYKQLSPHVLI